MAGMFYSLKETAERLGKTEDEVKQLATDGRLREFRDGSNLLFKIDEVNALVAEGLDTEAVAEPEMDLDLSLEPEDAGADAVAESEPDLEPDMDLDLEPEMDLELEPSEPEPAAEPEAEAEPDFDLAELSEPSAEADEPVEMADDDLPAGLEETAKGEVEMPAEAEAEASAFDLAMEDEAPDDDASTAEFSPDELLSGAEDEPTEEPLVELGDESEISLAQETGMMSGSDITNMDTALTGEGINILGDTEDDSLGMTDDSLAETIGPAGTGTEASLEEIEDDLNLDSFGSGSGLLDLSLQADDTSLGGILDDIYAADGAEEGAGEPGSVDDMTAEADIAVPEADLAVPEPVMAAPVAVGGGYAEAAPDTQSNMLGMLLFVPLVALLYTAIVAWAGQKGIMPSILGSIQGLIWMIIGGAVVATLGVFGASFVVGTERAPRAAKPKKEKGAKAKKEKGAKKEKAPKAKKEKAPKAAKAAKPAKGKTEKKPFFGKKK